MGTATAVVTSVSRLRAMSRFQVAWSVAERRTSARASGGTAAQPLDGRS